MAASGWSTWAWRLPRSPRSCSSTSRWRASPPPSASGSAASSAPSPQSIPVLIVEHDVDRVFGFADEVTVMNQGARLIHGTVEEVRNDRRVQEVYIGSGTEIVAARPLTSAARDVKLLELDKVNTFYGKSHILNDASLDRARGRDRGACSGATVPASRRC